MNRYNLKSNRTTFVESLCNDRQFDYVLHSVHRLEVGIEKLKSYPLLSVGEGCGGSPCVHINQCSSTHTFQIASTIGSNDRQFNYVSHPVQRLEIGIENIKPCRLLSFRTW